jgi:hypothetical protein
MFFVLVGLLFVGHCHPTVYFLLQKEELAYQHQFILHAALDAVQDLGWTTSAM